jgi:hypothetical protein
VLLKSVLRTGTANNDINPVKSMGLLDEGQANLSRITSTTAWWVQTDAPEGLKLMMRRKLEKGMEGDFETDSMRYKATERYAFGLDRPVSCEVHKGYYTYDNAVLKLTSLHLLVTCPEHGDFPITPNNHMRGKGCPVCGAAKRGHRKDVSAAARATADSKIARFASTFPDQARVVHGDKYNYSKVDYVGQQEQVEIVCSEHGSFWQTPEKHLSREQGCPGCSHHRSKGEAAIVKFVSIFEKPIVRDRSITGDGTELDIYLPGAKLAIEYCGEYWHSARTFADEKTARHRHHKKYLACREKGIRLLTIYEGEWLSRPKVLKRLIRNAMNKGRGSVMARECEVKAVGHAQGSAFFDRYHPQGGGGSGQNYALFYRGKIVACMRFTFGANDRGANDNRMWTLSRYATRIRVVAGASRLLSNFRKAYPDVEIKSFSDNRYFTGDMYERLGFTLEEETRPDYGVWHQITGVLPKAAWQLRNIPRRIRDVRSKEVFDPATDHRTETDMIYLLGARRIFDCGKKRWVLRP